MRLKIDLTGRHFGKLEVLKRAENGKNGAIRWLCLCDCGNKTIVQGSNLKNGRTSSCGCNMYSGVTKHGHYGERIYNVWDKMRNRCNNMNYDAYESYGGRGIKVCDEWNDFETFYNWSMTHGYSDNLTLDRVDNDDGYSPENCRWATRKEQARNRRSSRWFTYGGKTLTMIEWSEVTGIPYHTLSDRINEYGWDIERALTTPTRKMNK